MKIVDVQTYAFSKLRIFRQKLQEKSTLWKSLTNTYRVCKSDHWNGTLRGNQALPPIPRKYAGINIHQVKRYFRPWNIFESRNFYNYTRSQFIKYIILKQCNNRISSTKLNFHWLNNASEDKSYWLARNNGLNDQSLWF